MRAAVFALSVTLLSSPTLAQTAPEGEWGDAPPPRASVSRRLEIPTSNVDALCSQKTAGPSARYCVQEEQDSYNQLKELWPTADEATKRESLLDAKPLYDTPRYYRMLLDSMQGRLAVARQRRDSATVPRFQR